MKMLKSRKALSPVVASIILIAVTVAVSLAVAVWMGALSFSFMGSSEQLNVGTPYGWTNGGGTLNIVAMNPGGSPVTIQSVRINGTAYSGSQISGNPSLMIQPASAATINVTGVSPTFLSGYYYAIVLVTSKNHEFQTTGVCP
jgi:flagellin-like protein